MSPHPLDPALIGIWLLPGHPQTYEVTGDGSYYIAEPDEPVSFQNGGAQMTWGGRTYTRVIGSGLSPVGTWREDRTGDGWDFTDDCAYTILSATDDTGETFTGIWALRNEGLSLWTCEKQADIEADGTYITFETPLGQRFTYGYRVNDGIFALLDPDTWLELTRYISTDRMGRSDTGS